MFMHRNNYIAILVVTLAVALLTGCYDSTRTVVKPANDSIMVERLDSISFARTHHYSINYNFTVSADSLVLTRQMPEETVSELPTDSFAIGKNETLAVADVVVLPTDTVDSVWVQLAHVQAGFGWIHESDMLKAVEPDDPISQFISFFSDEHLLIFLGIFVLILFTFGMKKLMKRNAYIVHFNDIATFYPTLLALVVATSATLYASIQMFETDEWREFYFHPSLNPFRHSGLLRVFLASVWAMLIVALAAADDIFRHLNFGDAILYILGLAGVCAFNYVVFSLTTMYYVGYLLLAAYIMLAVWRYLKHTRSKYICGNCGKQIKKLGRCPHCGAVNQ